MNFSLCKTVRLAAVLLAVAWSYHGYSAESDASHSAAVAPYFFIEGGDSGLDRMPLKKTAVDAKLNGYLASVALTQVYRNEGNRPLNATYIFNYFPRIRIRNIILIIFHHIF